MRYLICAKSLVGFLSAVYDSYYEHSGADSIAADSSVCLLTDTYTDIAEDVDKARKVRSGIISKGGRTFYDGVSDAYRSCNPDKERIIFEYLKLFFKDGRGICDRFSDARVVAFNDLTSKVYRELGRVPAFVRLQEMSNGVYYGFYSSDNDILDKVVNSLVPRFNTMRFVIHDYKRGKMAYYDGENTRYSLAPETVEIELSDSEIFFQKVWQEYHKTVSIKERKNPKLQRAFAPMKYRHFMNEF